LENELHSALDKVRAEDALKRKTSDFLRAEIAQRERGSSRFRLRFAAVYAILVLFTALSGYSVYFTPMAYIDFDVNPSVGFAVNRFGIVIESAAYNDAGAAVLQNVGVKNKTYGKAVKALLGAFIANGYLSENSLVSATVQANDKGYASSLLDGLAGVVNLSLADHHISAKTDLFPVDEEVMNAAHRKHMTPAKYLAITELQAVDPTATFEDCAEHSIGEILESISAHGNEHHDADNSGQSSGDTRQERGADDGWEEAGHHSEHEV
jgi:hypothetical protein